MRLDSLQARLDTQTDWQEIERSLSLSGYAALPRLLDAGQCRQLISLYTVASCFRSHIIMARYGFGQGEYKYFDYPLPPSIQELRSVLYGHLQRIANAWSRLMRIPTTYPAHLNAYLARCHKAGQCRSTPLMLKYGPGDYNCLHQDIYGEHVFPLQVAILLSKPAADFTGGEFLMVERSATHQFADVAPLEQGDAIVFTVNQRPAAGRRGVRKIAMRHGVAEIRSGERYTLGIIFHDAA